MNALQIIKTRLGNWPLQHKLAASGVTLMALTLAVLYWRGAFSTATPDPQAQIGAVWIKPVGSATAYAGNAACQNCHAREFGFYSASGHSHTVQAVPVGAMRPEFSTRQTVWDSLNHVLYAVRQKAGNNQVVAVRGTKLEFSTAHWVFGSGTQARTYLAQDNDNFKQLRITYYPPSKTWNFTPGSGPGDPFHEPLGDPYTPVQAAACFGCHTTVLTGSPQHLDLDHSLLNVGCESCHGPARNHVASVKGDAAPNGGKDALVKPPLHSGAQIMQLCGSCHRMPVSSSQDQPITEGQLARFPGVALPRSRCFTESAGKLSCITCHNPHQSTQQQKVSSFENACLSCHSAPHGKTCTRGMKSNCISCHMPLERISSGLPLSFHNHWIRKNPQATSDAAPSDAAPSDAATS